MATQGNKRDSKRNFKGLLIESLQLIISISAILILIQVLVEGEIDNKKVENCRHKIKSIKKFNIFLPSAVRKYKAFK